MALIPEDRKTEGLMLPMSIAENLCFAALDRISTNGIIDGPKRAERVAGMIDLLKIKVADPDLAVSSLSGGNQQKAIIARELDREHKLLVAVQPTRGLDVGAIEFIHKQLIAERDAGTAVLLMSLELEEVMNVSDRILVMYEGEIVGELDPKKTTTEELGLYMAGAKRQEAGR